jgi:autotransporter passenger strand-loop-strand repeat protein
VESGATANSTTVLSGGEIVLYYGATVNNLALNSGATELILSSGGIFTPAAIVNGGASQKSNSSQGAPVAATVGTTAAQLIQAMASFNAGSESQGALFESVSGGAFHVDSATLATDHHPSMHH